MQFFRAAVSIGVFIVILLVTYVAYIKLFRVDVVFYASLAAAGIALALLTPCLYFLGFFAALSALEKILIVLVCAVTGYAFAISVPTVIDRSLSFYILEKLQQRGGGIQLAKFNYIFTDEYMREHRLVEVRLTEQLVSRTITIENGCVTLTPRGERIATFGRWFRQNLLPRQRLLAGEYTSALTNPFERSDLSPDYICDPKRAN